MEFSPLLFMAVVWLLIVLPIIKLSTAANKRKTQANAGAQNAGAARGRQQQKQPQPKQPQPQAVMSQPRTYEPVRPSVLQPTIRVSEHDDSIYTGSLDAVTGEGYDPCHDRQLAPLNAAEAETAPAEAPGPGLQLGWTGSEIVRGFVMGEILNRRHS